VGGSWRRLHNEELHDLYALPNVIRVMRSRMMRWTGHVPCMGEMEMYTLYWLGNLTERNHSKGLGIDGMIVLEWILGK